MQTPIEMVLKELDAAHAVISRAQNLIKMFGGSVIGNSNTMNAQPNAVDAKTETEKVSTRSEEIKPSTTMKTVTASRLNAEATKREIEQLDLFTHEQFANAKRIAVQKHLESVKKKEVRHRGTPGIKKAEAFRNFREIVGDRTILDLADVNRIFGYNPSTSGTFVRNAIANGKLKQIQYGAAKKFLAKDVRSFMTEYYRNEQN